MRNNTARRIASFAKRRLKGPSLHRLEHLTTLNGATFVGNNRVLVRVSGGDHQFAFYVHADDKLLSPWIIITGRYESALTNHITKRLRPDSNCIDVGANFGYYTCLMGKHCPKGKIVAIEPNQAVYDLALDNILINCLHERADVIHAAAGASEGRITIYERVGRTGNSSIAPVGSAFTNFMVEPPERACIVPSMPLDNLIDRLNGKVDVIKIDVEGAEPLVLAGARKIIEQNPSLAIFMEWSPGQIHHAGFEVPRFCEEIASMGLHAFALEGGSMQMLGVSELAELPYQPAVLLTKRP